MRQGSSWYVCPGYVNGAALNSRAKIDQAVDVTRQKSREAKTDEERWAAAVTVEALRDERRRRKQIIQKGKKTRLENKRRGPLQTDGRPRRASSPPVGKPF